MNKTTLVASVLLAFALSGTPAVHAQSVSSDLQREIGFAEYYMKELEGEIARSHGAKGMYRNEREALGRVKSLVERYPDNPRVQALYARAQKAVERGEGNIIEIKPEMTQYLRNEAKLREIVWKLSEEQWKARLASQKTLEKTFPTPDFETVSADSLKDTYVVLEGVRYPMDQFVGATGEYIAVGKPSAGYYYINIGGRNWLSPYEAVKRYRREADSSAGEVEKWTVLGRITGVTSEIPQAGETKVGSFKEGWVVTPEALLVPGHVAAFYDEKHPKLAGFSGEEKIPAIKDGWYTVKSIPANVTPERLMEIFMTAIKEKNKALFLECVSPELKKGRGEDNLTYHWDLHQERFSREYVHATFSKAKIEVLKGFDSSDDLKNFFRTEDQKKKLKSLNEDKVEQATVVSQAWAKSGRQVGQPVQHRLRRVNGGRWYVLDYAPRF